MLIAMDNGFQSCMMAPTEILAQQHYNGIKELLEKTEVKVRLLTGSTKSPNGIKFMKNWKTVNFLFLWELMPFWKIK
jgi:RecG-like helicase